VILLLSSLLLSVAVATYDCFGARFGPVTSNYTKADNINILCKMFMYKGLKSFNLYEIGDLISLSLFVFMVYKNSITLTLNILKEMFTVFSYKSVNASIGFKRHPLLIILNKIIDLVIRRSE
jgi:hypothetical protein